MGACSILPRIIGQGRASELLYFGRSMSGEEGERWGFFNGLSTAPLEDAMAAAAAIASSSGAVLNPLKNPQRSPSSPLIERPK